MDAHRWRGAWLYEVLKPEVDELIVAIAEKGQGSKSDERDAWDLAEKLRVNASSGASSRAREHLVPCEMRFAATGW